MHRRPRLTVIGSLNMDISVSVGRLPGPGETVLGTGAVIAPGGKGANQALAAARLGGAVRMAGCVGDDEFGGRILAALAAEGVDLAPVRAVPGCATGLALITVDAAGQRAPCLVNLAPVPRDAPALVAAGIDWLVVNESEASQLLGRSVAGLSDAVSAASGLVAMGAGHAVVTAGSHGAALAGAAGTESVPGFSVRSVDSVGAGDAFVAALGVTLAAGIGPAAALRAACAAGATATTRQGAQAALPRPAEIRTATGVDWPTWPR